MQLLLVDACPRGIGASRTLKLAESFLDAYGKSHPSDTVRVHCVSQMELAPLNIRVNCLKPGPIHTSFWDEIASGDELEGLLDGIARHEVPMGRIGTAEDIAGPALFLASELSAYVTGLCMYVGGGIGYVYSHPQSFLLGKTPTGGGGN